MQTARHNIPRQSGADAPLRFRQRVRHATAFLDLRAGGARHDGYPPQRARFPADVPGCLTAEEGLALVRLTRGRLREKRHLRAGGDGTGVIYDTVLTQTAWDANGNTVRLVDDNGGTTAWIFDLLDRNTVMSFHDGSMRTNVFDPANDVVGYTDENGSMFANTFDVLGRKTNVGITLATGVVGTTAQSFQFDGIFRLTFCRDSVSGTNADCGFTYDSISRVLEEQQTYSGDTRYVTHNARTSYPATGFTFPNSRQLTVGFDALYRKNAINETSGGASIAAWQFFGARIATITLGNGIVTSFMNNAQTRSAIQAGQTTPGWGDITSDHLGYDGSGRAIGKRHILSGTTVVGFTTAYDPSSNKLFERALHAENRSALYANDSMDRLIDYQRGVLATGGGSITTPISLPNTNAQRAYALDGLGNWQNTPFTPVASPPGVELRTHNKLNQITAFGVAPASTPVLYDHGSNTGASAAKGNGNIIDDGTRLNAFDALNRLVTVKRKSDNATIGAYVYDAIGRRSLRTVSNGGLSGAIPSGTSRYLLDGQQIVEELIGATGSPNIQYVWGQYVDELVQLKALATIGPQPLSAGNYYLLSDLLYRSAALTNSSGGIVEAYDTDAYGNMLLFSGPGPDGLWFTNDDVQSAYSACRYVFTGREYDVEASLYQYRCRYQAPTLGRFIGKDPVLKDPNLYSYCRCGPISLLDPSGRTTITGKGAMVYEAGGADDPEENAMVGPRVSTLSYEWSIDYQCSSSNQVIFGTAQVTKFNVNGPKALGLWIYSVGLGREESMEVTQTYTTSSCPPGQTGSLITASILFQWVWTLSATIMPSFEVLSIDINLSASAKRILASDTQVATLDCCCYVPQKPPLVTPIYR